MNKMIATLVAGTMIMPTIASAQDGGAMNAAISRSVCGADVRPMSADYVDIQGVTHLKVTCPRGAVPSTGSEGVLGTSTLTPTAATGLGLGFLGLGLIFSNDDENGTTTTTTNN
ncbi:hypothetical protein [Antarcticimicrobium sediminis]|uniref:Secreted protein n=1 Tax=Antarcticimicrobium sediminis TaxID=2546227 RepID=A0A4R5EFR3_9RHOB|nr:hypothetical protein [Antarcticimicrobium sediminis]TDE33235.1 hypothetical protein E1B25_21510 [Antarcticimicrobium sediminis]